MLYDLSIVWTPSTTLAELESTLAMAAELGYDVVAIDHIYNGAVPSTITNPLPDLSQISAASPSPTPRKLPKILRRATVVISDMVINHRLAALAAVYDIIAVRPTTEKAFQAACLSMAEPALISLDFTTYFPFYFKHRAAMAAVRRGVFFEVSYAQVLRAAAPDSSNYNNGRGRALFVANLAGLSRATRGRGFVVSSGAMTHSSNAGSGGQLELRGPADIVNLLTVWGMAPDKATEGMSSLPRSVVANEGLKRSGYRGVVDIVQVAGPAEADKENGRPQQGNNGTKQQTQQTQQAKQKNQNHKATQQQTNGANSGEKKRKAAGDEEGAAGTPLQAQKKQKKQFTPGKQQGKKQKQRA